MPTGESIVTGDISVTRPSTDLMTIIQGSNSAVVNWDSFSIGSGAHVDIRQPNSGSSILNRVTGDTTSEIHGRLTANGQVHIVNPNGIFIGANGTVDTGAFVASTLDIADDDFEQGRFEYSGLGASATVENAGRVTIGQGGYAALLGGQVRNSGVVNVPLGRVGFASGERVTLDLSGDQFLQVALPTEADGNEALIVHSGTASAEGGRIEMRAATAREAARHAINLSGVAEARSVSMHNGTIVLGGGDGGIVTVSGQATTRSRPAADPGNAQDAPEIEITGQRIALSGAEIDASGAGGGGLIRIGGDFAGEGSLQRADTVTVDAATRIAADALTTGDGGRIAIWSDVHTDFDGTLSARGGDTLGNGGFIEVSSRSTLAYSGLADTRAANGDWGMLLLDPTDIIIDPGAGGEDALEANLATTSVTLDTFSSETDAGDITINADIDWDAATTLYLRADRNVILNGAINAPSGRFGLDVLGVITPGAGADINVDSFRLDYGTWVQNGDDAPLASFAARDFSMFTPGYVDFIRVLGGDGSAANPYQIGDVYGLQGIGGSLSSANLVLANDIDASGTEDWTLYNGYGFDPISSFNGTLDGAGHTISGLYINGHGEGVQSSALFHSIDYDATVSDLTITDADISGRSAAVLAVANYGLVRNVRVSGTVDGIGYEVGGLVGLNAYGGLIEDSVADVAVTANIDGSDTEFQDYRVGGFVGWNSGTISRSNATGDVNVTNSVSGSIIRAGGFAGQEGDYYSGATINDSHAHGDVTVDAGGAGLDATVHAGGFVGTLDGRAARSFSTGSVAVSGALDDNVEIGGFAGVDVEGVSDGNFWDTTTSGLSTSAAATGLTTAQFQDTETFLSIASGEGWDFGTVWAPGDTGYHPVNYSTSAVLLATPEDLSVQYGLTPTATTTGAVAGGSGSYVFDDPEDTLDTDPIFSSLTFPNRNVGTRSFTLDTGSVTSEQGVTYRVIAREGSATITAAPLTITADDATKMYGQVAPLTYTITDPLYFSDSVDDVLLSSDGNAIDAGVSDSPYAIDASGATGTGLSNYAITYVSGDLTVTPAPLVIRSDDASKMYGQTFTPTGYSVSGLLSWDSVDSVSLDSEGSEADAQVSGGPYAITASDASGSGLENYDISYVDGQLTVTPAPLVIRPDDASKPYGQTFTPTGYSVSGLLSWDSVDSVSLDSDGSEADAPVSGSPYAITASDASGSGLENYDISYVDGELTVTGKMQEDPAPVPAVAVVEMSNPADSFAGVAGAEGDVAKAKETLEITQGLAHTLASSAGSCDQGSGDVGRYLACLSDALNDFASELDIISTDLPPGMENVATIVQTARTSIDDTRARAAQRLAGAQTDAERRAISRDAVAEARSALDTASNEIRKAITLVRAEDPELAAVQRATVTTVAAAIDDVGIQLSRVTDL